MSDPFLQLAERKVLDAEIRQEIETAYGTRGKKALAAIDDHKIKRYLDFFIVEGKTARYVVDDDFCTCGDFMFRGRTCWHLLAVRIASLTKTYEPVDRWYHEEMVPSRGVLQTSPDTRK